MWKVEVTVRRWTSDDFPGWVECELIDFSGKRWLFEEKAAVVSGRLMAPDSLPCPGFIGCLVISDPDVAGVAQIDTQEPWGVTSVDGQSLFSVSSKLLSRS